MYTRYWFRLVAYQITNKIDTSKAATSGDHKNPGSLVQSLRISMYASPGQGVTDLNHFGFHSNIFDFFNLQYGVSVSFRWILYLKR